MTNRQKAYRHLQLSYRLREKALATWNMPLRAEYMRLSSIETERYGALYEPIHARDKVIEQCAIWALCVAVAICIGLAIVI